MMLIVALLTLWFIASAALGVVLGMGLKWGMGN